MFNFSILTKSKTRPTARFLVIIEDEDGNKIESYNVSENSYKV